MLGYHPRYRLPCNDTQWHSTSSPPALGPGETEMLGILVQEKCWEGKER